MECNLLCRLSFVWACSQHSTGLKGFESQCAVAPGGTDGLMVRCCTWMSLHVIVTPGALENNRSYLESSNKVCAHSCSSCTLNCARPTTSPSSSCCSRGCESRGCWAAAAYISIHQGKVMVDGPTQHTQQIDAARPIRALQNQLPAQLDTQAWAQAVH